MNNTPMEKECYICKVQGKDFCPFDHGMEKVYNSMNTPIEKITVSKYTECVQYPDNIVEIELETEVSKRVLMNKINELIDVLNAMREVPNVCAHTYKHNGFAYVCQNCGKAEITR